MSYERLSAQELFRLCAGARDPEAWVEFHRRFHRTIAGVVVKTLVATSSNRTGEVEDGINEVYLRLCRNGGKALRDFVPTGPNAEFGYLKIISRNAILDKLPGRVLELPVASEAYETDPDREILLREIDDELKENAIPRDRLVFWLYYRDGLTAEEISSLPTVDLTAKGVESLLGRVTKSLRPKFTPSPEGKAGAAEFM